MSETIELYGKLQTSTALYNFRTTLHILTALERHVQFLRQILDHIFVTARPWIYISLSIRYTIRSGGREHLALHIVGKEAGGIGGALRLQTVFLQLVYRKNAQSIADLLRQIREPGCVLPLERARESSRASGGRRRAGNQVAHRRVGRLEPGVAALLALHGPCRNAEDAEGNQEEEEGQG